MCDTGQAVAILGEVCRACDAVFGKKISDAYLYGSYARGDYNEESDVDILLTVDAEPEELPPYRKALSHVRGQLRAEIVGWLWRSGRFPYGRRGWSGFSRGRPPCFPLRKRSPLSLSCAFIRGTPRRGNQKPSGHVVSAANAPALSVYTERRGDMVRIVGPGFSGDDTERQKEHSSQGLENVRRRLETQCGGSLHVRSGENGTRLIVLIP